ncbi:MAG: hypothetical protein ACYS9C_07360 [Planctomycetota bacterium]|jgi:hypothetical protein
MKYFSENIVLTDYYNRLDGDRIDFLKNKRRVRTKLMQLITRLKGNISRREQNKQLETAQEIWKLLMVTALANISISKSVRGFGALFDYYRHFVEFEDVLFGVDPTYRDHTMHTLWVYFLGNYILSRRPFIRKYPIDWGIEVREDHNKKASKEKQKIEDILNKYKDAVYCIIALSHDLAYPFERTEKINKRLEKISVYMGIRSFEHLEYNFSQEQSWLIGQLLEFVSQKVVISANEIESKVVFVKDNPIFADMSQSFEQHKHGILSSYLLHRLVDTIGEATFTEVGCLPDKEKKIINLILRKTILYTIASHTCDYAYSNVYNNFRFLLSLVDELEEFSRYKRQGRDRVNEICKSGLKFEGPGQLCVEYKFEKKHIAEPKRFFRDRAIRFCRMIDANQQSGSICGIRELLLSCVDIKNLTSPKEYSLKINKRGVFCKKSSSSGWMSIYPDPETEIQGIFK